MCRLNHGTIAVIGTAGRREDARRLSRDLYDLMYRELIKTLDEWQITSAVSGGAAWADHLAVRAFLDGYVRELLLFLPAEFKNGRFLPNPDIKFNPGRSISFYHESFAASCGIDSLAELARAVAQGAKVTVVHGFQARNLQVAAHADTLLAFTFGSNRTQVSSDYLTGDKGHLNAAQAGLKSGGTAHTWTHAARAKFKRHVNLFALGEELVPCQQGTLAF